MHYPRVIVHESTEVTRYGGITWTYLEVLDRPEDDVKPEDGPVRDVWKPPRHKHCPVGHEHPQEFLFFGAEWCGYCWYHNGVLTEMVECTPEVCGE